ncbi:MAG: hypothetical protein IK064_05095 [Clostridia bacterium]|nr:hypothetical protein [Clostridia bacterium]
MKRVMLFITVLICAAAAVLLVGCTKKAGPHIDVDELPGSGSDVLIRELTFSEDFDPSGIKDTAMIYKAYPVEVTEEYIVSLAEKMQMSDSTVNDDGQSLRVSDGKGNSIVVFKASGSIFCSFSDRAAIVDSELEALYTDEEYCAAAREWIESAGLLTDEYDVEDVRIADNGFVTKTVGEKEERYPTLKTVTYMRRDLDGLGFSGAAPRIIVDLSLDGKVVGVTKLQRAFEPFEEYPLTEIENAVRKLENGEGVFYRSGNTSDTGVIDSAELMYYNREAMDSSTYLIPVYVLHGTSGEGQFTAVVIAVDENCYTVTGINVAGQ